MVRSKSSGRANGSGGRNRIARWRRDPEIRRISAQNDEPEDREGTIRSMARSQQDEFREEALSYYGMQLKNNGPSRYQPQTIYYSLPHGGVPSHVVVEDVSAGRSSISESRGTSAASIGNRSAAYSTKPDLEERLEEISRTDSSEREQNRGLEQRTSSFLDKIFGMKDNAPKAGHESVYSYGSYYSHGESSGNSYSDGDVSTAFDSAAYFYPREILATSKGRTNSSSYLKRQAYVENELNKKSHLGTVQETEDDGNSTGVVDDTEKTNRPFHAEILQTLSGGLADIFSVRTPWSNRRGDDNAADDAAYEDEVVVDEAQNHELQAEKSELQAEAFNERIDPEPYGQSVRTFQASLSDYGSIYSESGVRPHIRPCRLFCRPGKSPCRLFCRPGKTTRERQEAELEEQSQLSRDLETAKEANKAESEHTTVMYNGSIERLTKEESLLLQAWRTTKANADKSENQGAIQTSMSEKTASSHSENPAPNSNPINTSPSSSERSSLVEQTLSSGAAVLTATRSLLSLTERQAEASEASTQVAANKINNGQRSTTVEESSNSSVVTGPVKAEEEQDKESMAATEREEEGGSQRSTRTSKSSNVGRRQARAEQAKPQATSATTTATDPSVSASPTGPVVSQNQSTDNSGSSEGRRNPMGNEKKPSDYGQPTFRQLASTEERDDVSHSVEDSPALRKDSSTTRGRRPRYRPPTWTSSQDSDLKKSGVEADIPLYKLHRSTEFDRGTRRDSLSQPYLSAMPAPSIEESEISVKHREVDRYTSLEQSEPAANLTEKTSNSRSAPRVRFEGVGIPNQLPKQHSRRRRRSIYQRTMPPAVPDRVASIHGILRSEDEARLESYQQKLQHAYDVESSYDGGVLDLYESDEYSSTGGLMSLAAQSHHFY